MRTLKVVSITSCKCSFGMGQVDDGTPNFGSEITLRGLFEAGSVSSAAGPPLEKPARVEGATETYFGWEGAVLSQQSVAQVEGDTSKESAAQANEAEGATGLVICLCFEGGPGTVGTVKVSSPMVLDCPRQLLRFCCSSCSHAPCR